MQMGSLGFPELLVILFVVLLLFGPKRLPEVARGLGKAVHDFRRGLEKGVEEAAEPAPGDGSSGAEPASTRPEPAAPIEPAAPPDSHRSAQTGAGEVSSDGEGGDPPARAA